jgi:hypothetical protein
MFAATGRCLMVFFLVRTRVEVNVPPRVACIVYLFKFEGSSCETRGNETLTILPSFVDEWANSLRCNAWCLRSGGVWNGISHSHRLRYALGTGFAQMECCAGWLLATTCRVRVDPKRALVRWSGNLRTPSREYATIMVLYARLPQR